MIDDDRRARIYALNLLNRLGREFDLATVNQVAAVLPLIEADVADWLAGEMVGTASRTPTVAGVRAGKHRPPSELKANGGAVLSRPCGDGPLIEDRKGTSRNS